MFEIVRDQAKLRPADFAALVGVSRVTTSLWFNGHASPHRLLKTKVNRLLEAGQAAVQDGQLPVPEGVPRKERSAYIKKVFVGQLRKLAPAT